MSNAKSSGESMLSPSEAAIGRACSSFIGRRHKACGEASSYDDAEAGHAKAKRGT